MGFLRGFHSLTVALCAAMAVGCANSGVQPAPQAEAESADSQLIDYRLGPADKIRVIVFGEPDLSGEFSVNGRGQLSLPLLGDVGAEGRTIDEVRESIAAGLSEGYVVDARVAAEVIEYRPYYVLGEVGAPGEYPYSVGISVFKAVAAAEGFTYRANKSVVFIKRANGEEEMKYKLTPQLQVFPGDVVRIGERFF